MLYKNLILNKTTIKYIKPFDEEGEEDKEENQNQAGEIVNILETPFIKINY